MAICGEVRRYVVADDQEWVDGLIFGHAESDRDRCYYPGSFEYFPIGKGEGIRERGGNMILGQDDLN